MIAPDRVAFTIFGLDVMWYGLLIGFGFLLATLISYKRADTSTTVRIEFLHYFYHTDGKNERLQAQ